jgi:hypothetical protein
MGKIVHIDDDVMRAAEKIAAERGVTVDQAVSDLARRGLGQMPDAGRKGPAGTILKNGWYVLPPGGRGPLTSEDVERMLLEADLEDAGVLRRD